MAVSTPSSAADPQRILIVRPTALGDVSRTVPALVTLRQAYPDAQIDWLVAEAFADVVQHHPMLDGVITFARDRLAGVGLRPSATREGLALRRQLRAGRYDVVYDLQGLFRSGLITWLTRAPRRVGYADARELGWLGYNVRHAITGRVHAVDRMLALLEADGLSPMRDMRLYVGDADAAWLREFREQSGIGSEAYACLAPTARWGSKCWPIGRYADIARRLLESELGVKHLVLLASPSEQPRLDPIVAVLSDEQRARVHRPSTRVGQLMALLSEAMLLVCNDSAPLHIAVGLDRPVVAVFGPTDPAAVGPYGREDAVVRPPEAAQQQINYRRHQDDQSLIAKVSADEVWEKIEKTLAADERG